jgi:hypothetical protein
MIWVVETVSGSRARRNPGWARIESRFKVGVLTVVGGTFGTWLDPRRKRWRAFQPGVGATPTESVGGRGLPNAQGTPSTIRTVQLDHYLVPGPRPGWICPERKGFLGTWSPDRAEVAVGGQRKSAGDPLELNPRWKRHVARVELGAEAPEFALEDFSGKGIRLSDFRGKAHVVLVFNRGFT